MTILWIAIGVFILLSLLGCFLDSLSRWKWKDWRSELPIYVIITVVFLAVGLSK